MQMRKTNPCRFAWQLPRGQMGKNATRNSVAELNAISVPGTMGRKSWLPRSTRRATADGSVAAGDRRKMRSFRRTQDAAMTDAPSRRSHYPLLAKLTLTALATLTAHAQAAGDD